MDELVADVGLVRKLWTGEIDQYREHLLRLDPQSRRNRFGGGVSDERIRRHVASATATNCVLHGFFVGGTLRGASELRLIGSSLFARKAEAAFSVELPWQSHGIGSALLERTMLAARNRAIVHIHMACLADNKRMQQLARKFEAQLSFDLGSVVGAVENPRPTALSLLREFVADGESLAVAMLDAQARFMRPGER